MIWRDKIDPLLKTYLERQIVESVKHKKAFQNSKNPGLSQLWVAVANLSREIFDLTLKFNYLERALRELSLEKRVKEKTRVKRKTKRARKK